MQDALQDAAPRRVYDDRGDQLLRLIPASAERVLCCGRTAAALARQLKSEGRGYAAALSQDAANLEHIGADRVVCAAPDAGPLPYPAASFDCIVCHESLEAVRSPERAIEHIAACLAPGGVLLLCAANLQYYKTVLMLAEGRWEYRGPGILDRAHLKFFTAIEIARLVEGAGLHLARLQPWVMDDPVLVPRDASGCLVFGAVTIGPLSDQEHVQYLSQQYLAIVTRSPAPDATGV